MTQFGVTVGWYDTTGNSISRKRKSHGEPLGIVIEPNKSLLNWKVCQPFSFLVIFLDSKSMPHVHLRSGRD